jgi:HSP20 family protein
MTLLRVYPFSELTTLQREMDRLFGDLVERTELPIERNFLPAAEMETLPEQYLLNVEIPGLNPEDIDIKATANSIAISGERKSGTETETTTGKRSEFRYGKFYRTIDLPDQIAVDAVTAQYDRGVLKLTLPRVTVEKNKVVDIKVAA